MSKKTMGIIIPYYKNSEECEEAFKSLMDVLAKQVTDDMILFVWEDGQLSKWLQKYNNENIIISGSTTNHGVSFARNQGIEYLIKRVNYILFIDSDDMVDDDYLEVMRNYCADATHEVVESTFFVNEVPASFNSNLVRSGAAGSALKCDILQDVRFKENMQIAEDTTFMNEAIDLKRHRKIHAPTKYIYKYGANPNSLIMRYNRKEIEEKRSD